MYDFFVAIPVIVGTPQILELTMQVAIEKLRSCVILDLLLKIISVQQFYLFIVFEKHGSIRCAEKHNCMLNKLVERTHLLYLFLRVGHEKIQL